MSNNAFVPSAWNFDACSYQLQPGDTCNGLAKLYGVSRMDILKAQGASMPYDLYSFFTYPDGPWGKMVRPIVMPPVACANAKAKANPPAPCPSHAHRDASTVAAWNDQSACVCDDGYVNQNGACVPKAACAANQKYDPSTNTCVCPPGYDTQADGSCTRRAPTSVAKSTTRPGAFTGQRPKGPRTLPINAPSSPMTPAKRSPFAPRSPMADFGRQAPRVLGRPGRVSALGAIPAHASCPPSYSYNDTDGRCHAPAGSIDPSYTTDPSCGTGFTWDAASRSCIHPGQIQFGTPLPHAAPGTSPGAGPSSAPATDPQAGAKAACTAAAGAWDDSNGMCVVTKAASATAAAPTTPNRTSLLWGAAGLAVGAVVTAAVFSMRAQ